MLPIEQKIILVVAIERQLAKFKILSILKHAKVKITYCLGWSND
jgi:hypothetical protein